MKSAPPHTPHSQWPKDIAARDQKKSGRGVTAQVKQQPGGNWKGANDKVDGQHDGDSGPGASVICAKEIVCSVIS